MGIARARSKRCRRSSAMEIKGYLDEWGFNVIQSRKIRTCGFHGRLGLKHKKNMGLICLDLRSKPSMGPVG